MNITVRTDGPEKIFDWGGKFKLTCMIGEAAYIMNSGNLIAATLLWRERTDQEVFAELESSKLVKRLCKELSVTPENLAPALRKILTDNLPQRTHKRGPRQGEWVPVK